MRTNPSLSNFTATVNDAGVTSIPSWYGNTHGAWAFVVLPSAFAVTDRLEATITLDSRF